MLAIGDGSAEADPYLIPSYNLTMAGIVIFIIALVMLMGGMSAENKKSAVSPIIASITFIVAMCVMFADVSFSDGVMEAAKSA